MNQVGARQHAAAASTRPLTNLHARLGESCTAPSTSTDHRPSALFEWLARRGRSIFNDFMEVVERRKRPERFTNVGAKMITMHGSPPW